MSRFCNGEKQVIETPGFNATGTIRHTILDPHGERVHTWEVQISDGPWQPESSEGYLDRGEDHERGDCRGYGLMKGHER